MRNGYWGWATSFFDYDNDGHLDLVMTDGVDFPDQFIPAQIDVGYHNDPMRLWRNDGTGRFSEVSAAEGVTDTRSGKGLLTFDFDKDGDLDVFVVNNGDQPALYRNDVGNDNKWLQVTTVGLVSNRDGIGAVIKVTPDLGRAEDTMIREMDGGNNFLGQNEMIAHFGLGPVADGAVVDRVQIRWPSGLVQAFYNVPTNTRLVATESSDLTGDLTLDGEVNDEDIDALAMAIRRGDSLAVFDLDGDERVDERDVKHLITVILETAKGDADLNRLIDVQDFAQLAGGFGYHGGWSDGNFNEPLDEMVDVLDFAILAANFGADFRPSAPDSTGSATVPEPDVLLFLVLGTALILTRRP